MRSGVIAVPTIRPQSSAGGRIAAVRHREFVASGVSREQAGLCTCTQCVTVTLALPARTDSQRSSGTVQLRIRPPLTILELAEHNDPPACRAAIISAYGGRVEESISPATGHTASVAQARTIGFGKHCTSAVTLIRTG